MVCYRIDRLTRSLTDFTRLIDIFERKGTSLVSITENFNTATSIGRLNLHMILSFAQYERELAGERIRDKFLASRKRGLWMGGHAPLGYERPRPQAGGQRGRGRAGPAHLPALPAGGLGHQAGAGAERRGAPHQARQAVRQGRRVQAAAQSEPMSARSSTRERPTRASTRRSSTATPGTRSTRSWRRTRHRRASRTRAATPALLKGLIFGPDGKAMAPSHTRRRGRLYRFYRTATSLKLGHDACPIRACPQATSRRRSSTRSAPCCARRRWSCGRGAPPASRTSGSTSARWSRRCSGSIRCGISSSRPSRRASSSCWSRG